MQKRTAKGLLWTCHNVYTYRNDLLAGMGFPSYRAYLASPLWASIRARVLTQTDGTARLCVRCEKPATQVHHRAYDPATLRGDSMDSLSPVCGRHHRAAERLGAQAAPADRLWRANNMIHNGHEKTRRPRRRTRAAKRAKNIRRQKFMPSVAQASTLAPKLVKA